MAAKRDEDQVNIDEVIDKLLEVRG